MLSFSLASVALLSGIAQATIIYVASYDGNVTTLDFEGSTLTKKFANPDCAGSPVWLQLDTENRILICSDEGNTTPGVGSINLFDVGTDGNLTRYQRVNTTVGPVSSTYYGSEPHRGITFAHYSGSAVTAYNVSCGNELTDGETLNFTLAKPGPNPAQTASHIHEVIRDPLNKHIVTPDLGADLVRIFSIDEANNLLTEIGNASVPAGTGPRHGVFWSTVSPWDSTAPLYFFLIAEFESTITSFQATYDAAGALSLTKVGTPVSTYGNYTIPPVPAGAEIAVSPDNRFIVASNRNDSSFMIDNFDPSNSTKIPSDSFAVFQPSSDGQLSFRQLYAAGGIYPRQFAINNAGDKVVVGLQLDSRVVVHERDVQSGLFTGIVSHIDVPGQITATIWDE